MGYSEILGYSIGHSDIYIYRERERDIVRYVYYIYRIILGYSDILGYEWICPNIGINMI